MARQRFKDPKGKVEERRHARHWVVNCSLTSIPLSVKLICQVLTTDHWSG